VVRSGSTDLEVLVRVVAGLHLAQADVMIQVWRDKYRYQTARPVTLLSETEPGWGSYLVNPPFPAYPSGHAAVSVAAARYLAETIGDRPFTDDGSLENPRGMTVLNIAPRSFPSFEAAGVEAGLSRLWGGIHTRDDIEGGRRIGESVSALHVADRAG
jgi:membrane-associated phospholipid phosphatase